MKKVMCVLLAVLCVFSLVSCAGQNEEKERIERVITRVLTCPDEELVSLLKNYPVYIDGETGSMDEELLLKRRQAEEQYAEHLKTVFSTEDMTEDYQQQFCGSVHVNLIFPSICASGEISITVESVAVELISEDNRRYGYSAELVITDPLGEETSYTQEGKVQLSEDGRVSWIDVMALMELSDIVVRVANGMA